METIAETEYEVEASWPTLAVEAFYGLLGDIVQELDKYTEADRVAVLSHLLAEFSCYIGNPPVPQIELGGLMHPPLFWTVNTGATAKGRKGTAKREARLFMECAFPQWSKGQRARLETGRLDPQLSTLLKLCRALEITPNQLIGVARKPQKGK